MPTIDNYYQDFDPAKNYDEFLFRDGYTLQGRELNNMQKQAANHIAGIASALFKDGDIISDAQIAVNAETGEVNAQAGAVFIKGARRNVPEARFVIPVSGVVTVGVYLTEKIISELDDDSLYNPAVGSRGEGEAGAWRLRVAPRWGWSGDGGEGEFYPVHTVEDGIPRAKEVPPNLDSFTQSIAKYDRDSTGGGSDVVSGLTVLQAPDHVDGKQVYTVSEGRARVNGYGIEQHTSRRITYNAVPDLRVVDTEVHTSLGEAAQRITISRPPAKNYTGLRITRQKTVDVLHGSYSGAQDDLPDTSVVDIVECRQGDTVYVKNSEYRKNGDRVDWSLPGAEPAAGSTYSVTYQYIAQVEPESPDHKGFSVTGAVAGSSILVSYNQMLPRYDRLAITSEGEFVWITGVASDKNPRSPAAPVSVLPIATVYQAWTDEREVESDGVCVVPFSESQMVNKRIDYLFSELARQRLEADVSTRESGARKGVFVDPLLDDSCRDQGIPQTAAVVNGMLTLPIAAEIAPLSQDVAAPSTNPYGVRVLLSQPLRTGSMKVNPYMAFAPLPAQASITPAVDQWTETDTQWTSAITQRLSVGKGGSSKVISTSVSTQVAGTATTALEHLRQIDVKFELRGFGPGEILDTVTFDGVEVTPTA